MEHVFNSLNRYYLLKEKTSEIKRENVTRRKRVKVQVISCIYSLHMYMCLEDYVYDTRQMFVYIHVNLNIQYNTDLVCTVKAF